MHGACSMHSKRSVRSAHLDQPSLKGPVHGCIGVEGEHDHGQVVGVELGVEQHGDSCVDAQADDLVN